MKLERKSEAPWARNSLRHMSKELHTLADLAHHRGTNCPSVRDGAMYIAQAYDDAAALITERMEAIEDAA